MDRNKVIVRTSVMGITVNILLVVFKATIGLLSNSIAIVLDAVNNLSDVLSALITIAGAKLAGRQPDEEHPYGHGRYEYISAIMIAVLILYAGFASVVESVKKIISPKVPHYNPISLIIIFVAVITKLAMSIYIKKVGEKVNSNSLIVTGIDARFDALISAATLVAAWIFITFKISIEAYLALGISLLLLKSGYEMLTDTLSLILGKRIAPEKSKSVRECMLGVKGVDAVYDLIFTDYGPDTIMGTAHIEVDANLTAIKIDEITREITDKVYEKEGVIMTGVGIYAKTTENQKNTQILESIRRATHKHKHILQIHGFYVNVEKKIIRFDMIVGFEEKNREALYEQVLDDVRRACEGFEIQIMMDVNYCD